MKYDVCFRHSAVLIATGSSFSHHVVALFVTVLDRLCNRLFLCHPWLISSEMSNLVNDTRCITWCILTRTATNRKFLSITSCCRFRTSNTAPYRFDECFHSCNNNSQSDSKKPLGLFVLLSFFVSYFFRIFVDFFVFVHAVGANGIADCASTVI
jgi:hypothetical protein